MPPAAAKPDRKRIAVIGLGSIGGVIAGLLRAADRHDIVACVRHPIDQLTVERSEGAIELPITALTDPAQAKPVDWVLLCTKAQDSAASAPWLQRLCGADTRVATLQNGIGHAERLAPFVARARVIPTIVYYNGERLARDRVRYRSAGEHDFAVADDADGQAFAVLLDNTSMRVLLSADFRTLAWRKLLLNAVANPVSALTLQRNAVFRRDDVKGLCLALLEEAAAVGRADGAQLAADEPEQTMNRLLAIPPDAASSMYFDRLAGRPLEIEALTGAVVAAGERHHIATPLSRAVLVLARALSDGMTEKPLT
jgi:2-dehydropantoate 2-reductase